MINITERFELENRLLRDDDEKSIGQQLVTSLLAEDHFPGHRKGIVKFVKLMDTLHQNIENEQDITVKDTASIINIIVTKNWPKLFLKVLNNPWIPDSNSDGVIVRKSINKAIRIGSLDVLRVMIDEKVPILSPQNNTFEDLKSLIFNILCSVEIDQSENKIVIANMMYYYLAKVFYESYKDQNKNKDIEMMTEWKQSENELDKMKYSKHFVSNPFVRYAIYKKVDASSIGRHYVKKLQRMLQFLCEHHLVFDDDKNLDELYQECVDDKKFFDGSGLIKFKNGYFWGELCNKLIADYFGFGKRKFKNDERSQMIDLIEYIIANGAGNRLDEIVMPCLEKKEYAEHEDVQNVLNAVECGKNVWILKKMDKEKVIGLFGNVCSNHIDFPQYLCTLVLSFVLLN